MELNCLTNPTTSGYPCFGVSCLFFGEITMYSIAVQPVFEVLPFLSKDTKLKIVQCTKVSRGTKL